MLLRAIAIDYDGTIAENGVLNPDVREAIAEARAAGLYVVIATGRILRELRKVAGDLSFVDGVVAENGAVILLANGHRRLLGPPPFPILLRELSHCGIEFVVGRCLVDMEAEYAETVLSIIRQKELPLMIAFNKNRMMVLPRSISKSSGLREILDILGTTIHNTIGIGNAENDYELLRDCEFGAAVSWAPDFLKSEADFVIPGDRHESVADYIRSVAENKRLPTRGMSHRTFVLESLAGKESFEVANRGRNILIAGDSKSGKSWLAGLFCEQMIQHRYTVIIVDPEGDYSSLTSLPNTLMIGSGNPLPDIEDLDLLFRQGLSLIFNFSRLQFDEKADYIKKLLLFAAKYRKNRGYPHAIFIDECHYFLDEDLDVDVLDPELGSYILVTYLPSLLKLDVIRGAGVLVAARMTDRTEVDAISIGKDPESLHNWYEILAGLETTEAVLLPPTEEAGGKPRTFTVAPRLTNHVRHRRKYFDVCLEQSQAFVYTRDGVPVGSPVLCLHDLMQSSLHLEDNVLIGHLKRHDFSCWIESVFKDDELAMSVRELEKRYEAGGDLSGFTLQLAEAIQKKYDDDFKSI